MKLNKAAMFGLDARIALAIFGALSVISGAALYSAIQQAKVTSLITDMNEVDKASIAYMLDTGSPLPFATSAGPNAAGMLAIDNLVTKVHAESNAPYLSYEDFNTTAGHDHIVNYTTPTFEMYIAARENTAWSNFTTTVGECRKTSANCNQYSCMWGPSHDLFKAIETQIDGTATPGDDSDSGNVRYNKAGSVICIKGATYDPANSPLA